MAGKRTRRRRSGDRTLVIGGIILVVLVAAAVIVLTSNNSSASTTQMASLPPPAPLDACGSQTCGQANAPVTLDVYADFQCPYCAQFEPVLQQIKAPYIDTGKVKLVYHNFAFIGAESVTAAQAAACAADQNKFWLFAKDLFSHQGTENSGVFTAANLKQMAAGAGLDTTAFNACLDSGKYASAVDADHAQGVQRGVQATPTFFINGQKTDGGVSYTQLTSMLDTALAN